MADTPQPKPGQAPKIPPPGSLPKLPDDIFNYEKKSGDLGPRPKAA